MTDLELANVLRDQERRRLRLLVEARGDEADDLHAADFELIHPSGGVWSKCQYLGGIVSGQINYRQFEPVSEIEVILSDALAVLRYRSVIDISIQGAPGSMIECWHTDCYQREADGTWRVRWSQATEVNQEA